MNSYNFWATIGLLLLGFTGYSQVNTDSLALVAKIMTPLAQQSADANSRAANSLSANPQDKTDARQADNAALDPCE